VIEGVHTLLCADDAAAARAFFRDVLGLRAVDGGDGWLIFALPPGELGVHPPPCDPGAGRAELFFMCRDIHATVSELEAKGVEFTAPVHEERWGLLTRLVVPGFGEVGLYEPRHPTPIAAFARTD